MAATGFSYAGGRALLCDDRPVSPDLVAQSRAAIRAGDAAGARRLLAGIPDGEGLGDVTEVLARASYLDLDFSAAIEGWERAYACYREAGDRAGAMRVARTLSGQYGFVVGDFAVSAGWLARAQTLQVGAEESSEAGWVALNLGMFEPDRLLKEERFRTALDVGRRFDDRELELQALAYLGASLVHADRPEEGMVLLDEALAAVAGGEVDDFSVLEEIFCQLFSACEHAHDVVRADEWIRIGDAIAVRRKLPAVSAFCRTHYGGVLTAAGRWPEAETTLTEAIRQWGLGHRSLLRAGALVRLAELRVRQGRFEEAEQLLTDSYIHPNDVARPMAAVHLSRGETALAADLLERALAQNEPDSTAAAAFLSLMVDVFLVAGQLDRAEAAAAQLATCAARHRSHYLTAAAALARGRVQLAAGTGDPQACLREALAGFARAQTPMELAHSRLALAHAMQAERPEVALVEARAALDAFERLQAARQADAAAAVLRSLGVKPATPAKGGGVLTKRETDVLELIGQGLSNPEISERLFISRKTVEHHVGNILAKLGLRRRAEVAAYAVRAAVTKPAPR